MGLIKLCDAGRVFHGPAPWDVPCPHAAQHVLLVERTDGEMNRTLLCDEHLSALRQLTIVRDVHAQR